MLFYFTIYCDIMHYFFIIIHYDTLLYLIINDYLYNKLLLFMY